MRLVVLGTGGHARAVLGVLLTLGGVDVVGCVGNHPEGRLQAAHLGRDEVLPELRSQGIDRAFVAVGDNAVRARLTAHAQRLGFVTPPLVAPSAVLAEDVELGANALLMPGVVVNAYSSIMVGAVVNTSASVDHDSCVGPFSHVGPGTHLAGGVQVGEGALLGVGVSVIPGRKIGEWSIVGAGAVVVRDVAPGTSVVGVPARPVE